MAQDTQLDISCVTSAVSCLSVTQLNQASRYGLLSVLGATDRLICDDVKLTQSFGGGGPSQGDFSKITSILALASSGSVPRTDFDPKQAAEDWIGKKENRENFTKAFWKLIDKDADFHTWLRQEVDYIWVPHASATGSLFNQVFIPDLATLLHKDVSDLNDLHKLSDDTDWLIDLKKTKRDSEEFNLLGKAYVGSYLLRGIYKYFEVRPGYGIMSHRLRQLDGFWPADNASTPASDDTSSTTMKLAYLILYCARNAPKNKRAEAYANYVSKARQIRGSLDLERKEHLPDSIDAAVNAAKKLELNSNGHLYSKILDTAYDLVPELAGTIITYLWQPYLQPIVKPVVKSLTKLAMPDRKNDAKFKKILDESPAYLRWKSH